MNAPTTGGGRWLGLALAAAVLTAGVAATLLAVDALAAADRDSARRVMDQRTAVARSAVSVETRRYLDLLHATAAGFGANDHVTAADFAAATAPLASARLVGATSVAFVVAGPPGQIPQIQRFWRSRGAVGLQLTSQPGPAEHAFSIFARSLNGGAPQIGTDISPSAEATAALNEARRTGAPTVSDTFVLLRDRGLPPNRQQLSFAFVAPVYTEPGGETGQPTFHGWIVLGLHGQDFLGGVLGEASQGLLDAELQATNGDGRPVRVAEYRGRGGRDLVRQATFPVANRQWTLVTRADSAVLPGAQSELPDTVLLGGGLVTLTLAWLVYVLATGRARARGQVRVATAELRDAEAEARRQAGLLSAIMASIGDGVGVVDADGAFLLHNPAAKQLLGVAVDLDGPAGWQEHYGLYRPDGHTPFPVDELPLVRGLHGESSNGVEMIIRNEARPDGILVSVDGRPLDASAGQHGAVAVFHDITELRRYEADLAIFAGVVAHDLKAPLAVIRGHCETVVDVLTAAPAAAGGDDLDDVLNGLRRIASAVDRMAALIDMLLAYTTSRDAPLRLQQVALEPLIAESVAERAAAVRPADGPGPDVYLGSLPSVTADPAMLRHVTDNLIGNALKYVRPGQRARVDVTAADAAPGWVRVEIADRGIGIPDEDKPNIFESFHRAQSAAGYAGTGLGLAICRRIVERHGGAIGVLDNPGGGTRIHFTLPTASPDALDRALAERAAVESAVVEPEAADSGGPVDAAAAVDPAEPRA